LPFAVELLRSRPLKSPIFRDEYTLLAVNVAGDGQRLSSLFEFRRETNSSADRNSKTNRNRDARADRNRNARAYGDSNRDAGADRYAKSLPVLSSPD
jgi:hypothetical protein